MTGLRLALLFFLCSAFMSAQNKGGGSNQVMTQYCSFGYFHNWDSLTSVTYEPDAICITELGTPACAVTVCPTSNFAVNLGSSNGSSFAPGMGPYSFVIFPSGGHPIYTVVGTTTNYFPTSIPFPYPAGTTYTITQWNANAYPNPAFQPPGVPYCSQLIVYTGGVQGTYVVTPNPACIGTQVDFSYTINTLGICSGNSANWPYIAINNPPATPLTGYLCNGNGTYGTSITYTAPGVYTGTFTTQFGWGSQATCIQPTVFTTTVLANTGPLTASVSMSNVCMNSPVTLSAYASGASGYTWQPGNYQGSSVTLNPTVSTVYTVTAGSCPTRTAVVGVTVTECCSSHFTPLLSNVTIVAPNPALTQWTSITGSGPYSGQIALPYAGYQIQGNYHVIGDLTVNTPVTFINSRITFGDNSSVWQNAPMILDRSYWYGCIRNWAGIRSAKLLSVTNSVIEDATAGISFSSSVGTPHPGVSIDNTIFNKNAFGVSVNGAGILNFKVTGCIFSSRDIPQANYIYTSGSRWTSLANFTTAALTGYPVGYLKGSIVNNTPANTYRGQSGIILIGAQGAVSSPNPGGDVIVGATSLTNNADMTNVFDQLRFGIQSYSSKLISYNNVFSYISYLSGIDSGPGTGGIYATMGTTKVGANTTGVGGAIPYANTFVNSQVGVYATSNGVLSVTNNNFTNISAYGVEVEKWYAAVSNATPVNITDNTFAACLYDLFAFDNNRINLKFSNNTTTYPYVLKKAQVTYMAYVDELSKPATAVYDISFNNCFGKVMGVYSTQVYGAAVNNNTITLRSPLGNFSAPVWLDKTDNSTVKSNILNYSPTNTGNYFTFGIFTNVGANNTYCSNDIKGASACLKFQGYSPAKVYLNSLNENPSDPCMFGLFLDNAGYIGDVWYNTGFLFATADNRFGDFYTADTYSQSSYAFPVHYQGPAVAGNVYYPMVNLASGSPNLPFGTQPNNVTGWVNCGSARPGEGGSEGSQRTMAEAAIIADREAAAAVAVYPNPASNLLTVICETEGATIELYDLIGQLVLKAELSAQTSLDVSELKSGTYFYKITEQQRLIKTDKLMIAK